MARSKKTKKLVLKLTSGVLNTTINFLLWQIYYTGALFGKQRTAGSFWRAYYEANEMLQQFNAQTISKTIDTLLKRGLISITSDGLSAKITKNGLKKLYSEVPFYDAERVWDGKIYLITYDIPEMKRNDRNILREQLKKISCGMLQASVWITFYNPKQVLEDFLKTRRLHGSVIISDLGKDGAVGEESLTDLIKRVYKLDELNQRYKEFFEDFNNKKVDAHAVSFAYLSILEDDPQLPFELLPEDWFGEKAYQIFLKNKH